MDFYHKPVLLDECIDNLAIKANGIYIDGTIGGAGHSYEILSRLDKDGVLIGIDQDEYALESSRKRLNELDKNDNIIFAKSNFKFIKKVSLSHGFNNVDGILLDIGVSSYQLDRAERGFSYQKDSYLDMRMDREQELTAYTIVNEYSQKDISRILYTYGEERWSSRIAEFIVNTRKKNRIKTTFELVEIIKAAIPNSARREGPHPAKRTFQALRIEVNDELRVLKDTIEDAAKILKPGGRLCIITFHSLEDRIVKNEYKRLANPCTCPREFPVCTCGKRAELKIITKKPILPSQRELDSNPRARSAKLRVAEKI